MDSTSNLMRRMRGGSLIDSSDRLVCPFASQAAQDILHLPSSIGIEVGRGSFGVAFVCHGGEPQEYVVKIPWPEVVGDPKHLRRWAQELRIGAQLRLEDPTHQCVVGYITAAIRIPEQSDIASYVHAECQSSDTDTPAIIEIPTANISHEEGVFGTMPRAQGVLGKLDSWASLTPVERMHLAVDVLQNGLKGLMLFQSAVNNLAQSGKIREITKSISHADVRPLNVLLFQDPHALGHYRPVLSDFGCARGIPGRIDDKEIVSSVGDPSTIPHIDIGILSRGWFRPVDPEGDARDDIRGIAACAILAFLGIEPTWLPRVLIEARDRGSFVQMPGQRPHTRLNRRRTELALMENPDVVNAIAALPVGEQVHARRLISVIAEFLCADSKSLESYVSRVSRIRDSNGFSTGTKMWFSFPKFVAIFLIVVACIVFGYQGILFVARKSAASPIVNVPAPVVTDSLETYVTYGVKPAFITRDEVARIHEWDYRVELFLICSTIRKLIEDDWYVKYIAEHGHAPSISTGRLTAAAHSKIPVLTIGPELGLMAEHSRFFTLSYDPDVIIHCHVIESTDHYYYSMTYEVQDAKSTKTLTNGTISTSQLDGWNDPSPFTRQAPPPWLVDPAENGRWVAVLGAAPLNRVGFSSQMNAAQRSAQAALKSFVSVRGGDVLEHWIDGRGNLYILYGVVNGYYVPAR